MQSITRKPEVLAAAIASLDRLHTKGIDAFAETIYQKLLSQKVRFPLLEYAGEIIFENIEPSKQIILCDAIIKLHTIGGNVIVGKLLQLRIEKHLKASFAKAEEYIIEGNEWYVCDIIGERVMGHGLLIYPEKVIPRLKKLAKQENNWMVRTIGVATHYATKKGMQKNNAEVMLILLLSLANTIDFHTKKGIGWAAKTIAKFHPDLIKKYEQEIYASDEVKQWFKTKVRIGLGRAPKYANKFLAQ